MKVIISIHAKKRIYERGISIRQIKRTLDSPDHIIKKSDGEINAFKKFGNKTLKIAYIEIEKGKFIKIITLHYL